MKNPTLRIEEQRPGNIQRADIVTVAAALANVGYIPGLPSGNAAYVAAEAAANAAKLAAIVAAEQQRQSAIFIAKDTLRSQGEYGY